MSKVARLLSQAVTGDPSSADELLPLIYDELRSLARRKLSREHAGQTLQATALVHEAYLRLLDGAPEQNWDSRGHFFAAAAEAMRRILIERYRHNRRQKRGGDRVRQPLDETEIEVPLPQEDLLALDEALGKLELAHASAAKLVKLRYFAGLTIPEAARLMSMSARSADRLWAYARAWLIEELGLTTLAD